MHLSLVLTVAAVPWLTEPDSQPLSARLPPPPGFKRIQTSSASFAGWLRDLPVKPGQPAVRLFDGRDKPFQGAQWLVLDVDVGERDLQQCADAVMRLYAEWQWSTDRRRRICFRYTSGHRIDWPRWSRGFRPKVRGRRVTLRRRASPDDSYRSFRRYLTSIFTYAGTASLSRDLRPVTDPQDIRPGDVFIKGGFPGHAVLVVDVVHNANQERRFALAQSYMPAQDIHVLRGPDGRGPWYGIHPDRKLETPEWTFSWSDLKRFTDSGCP